MNDTYDWKIYLYLKILMLMYREKNSQKKKNLGGQGGFSKCCQLKR